MSRLHRKCLAASTTAHGLLLLILLVGSAFTDPRPEPTDLPPLIVIPDKIVDAAIYGGGNPEAPPAPPPAVQAPAPSPQKAPQPELPREEPKPQPTPVVTTKQPELKAPETKATPPKPKPVIKVSQPKVRSSAPARQTAETKPRPAVADEIESRISGVASRLSRKLTTKTTIGVPGPGGPAFANYSQVIISIYQQAWMQPMGVEKAATVKATVTIARDGRVLSARITKLSGNRTVDDSVEQVLQRVKETRPFPEGATDATRTFDLSFELTPAELSG